MQIELDAGLREHDASDSDRTPALPGKATAGAVEQTTR